MRDADDRVSLVLTASAHFNVWHRGQELCLGPGDATLFQADAPGRCGSRNGFSMFEISMPQAEWNDRGVRPGDLLVRQIRRQSEGLKLLRGYVRSLETFGASSSSATRELVRRHVVDLAVLAATRSQPVGESGASAVMAARRAQVLDYIANRFQDPGLSIATVAESLRLSPRYVQRLLATMETTFTAYVTELRLQLALNLLTEGERQADRIADIALDSGFADLSNFNRLFRARFGDTPGGMRAQSLQKLKTWK
jgi:AraC-like DNA-binding protein